MVTLNYTLFLSTFLSPWTKSVFHLEPHSTLPNGRESRWSSGVPIEVECAPVESQPEMPLRGVRELLLLWQVVKVTK